MRLSVLRSQNELLEWRKKLTSKLGLVPTMGGLHPGHSQLIQSASNSHFNDSPSSVLVSIFINPLQFGPDEDFYEYPRDLDSDCQIAEQSGADAIWAPSIREVFPGGPEANFKINVPASLQEYLCGSIRKGHFDGVATVIIHLLRHVQPNFLVLGEKDWQQFVIVRKLIQDLCLPVKMHGVATVRDPDGLAYSSRNQYLSKSERERSLALPRLLAKATHDAQKGKALNLKELRADLKSHELDVDYLEVVDPHQLQPTKPDKHFSLLAASIKCGTTRLIDHTFLMTRKPIVAIDGPAGVGKSTVSRAFAKKLGLLYLDTGAMYRGVAWFILEKGINPTDHFQIKKILKDFKLELELSNNCQNVIVNGNNITNAIRSPKVTSIVSSVAAQQPVRESLTNQQKKIGQSGGLVAEGRDIGTAVFPNAELKIFLTASTRERAQRRSLDLQHQGFSVPSLDVLEQEIAKRDDMDRNREISPLKLAKDAKEVITDDMNIQEVVQKIEELFRLKIPEEAWPSPF